jgi:hypothetical protein
MTTDGYKFSASLLHKIGIRKISKWEHTMLEKIEGQGRLESTTAPEKVWQVTYHFDIATKIVSKTGLSKCRGK